MRIGESFIPRPYVTVDPLRGGSSTSSMRHDLPDSRPCGPSVTALTPPLSTRNEHSHQGLEPLHHTAGPGRASFPEHIPGRLACAEFLRASDVQFQHRSLRPGNADGEGPLCPLLVGENIVAMIGLA